LYVDKLHETDWVGIKGTAAADPKVRIRFQTPGPDGADYEAFYINGMFEKVHMAGEKRENDVKFTEIADEATKKRLKKGQDTLVRLYVEPSLKQCALKVFGGRTDGKDAEEVSPKPFEMVAFPPQDGVAFTYRLADRTLFLGKAATDRAVADKQRAGEGAQPQFEYGDVPVGVFTKATEDGGEDCTYDMDLYFDDRNVPALAGLPAGAVKGDWRHWYHLWKAPYSGNHHFEMYRYRTCSGGERTLIDVAGIEAVLL
jgi:hypothetical protein